MPGMGVYKTTGRTGRAKNRVDRPPLSSGKPLKFNEKFLLPPMLENQRTVPLRDTAALLYQYGWLVRKHFMSATTHASVCCCQRNKKTISALFHFLVLPQVYFVDRRLITSRTLEPYESGNYSSLASSPCDTECIDRNRDGIPR